MSEVISQSGVCLRKLREMAGISTRELAELAQVSRGYPGHIESGRRRGKLGAPIAIRLAAVLGCHFERLVDGTGPEPTEEEVRAAVASARARHAARAAHESGEHQAVDPKKSGTDGP